MPGVRALLAELEAEIDALEKARLLPSPQPPPTLPHLQQQTTPAPSTRAAPRAPRPPEPRATPRSAPRQSVTPTWAGLVEPLERIGDRLGRVWGLVSHLKAVKDSEALRKAYEEVQPERVKLGLRLAQSRPFYDAFLAIRNGPAWQARTRACLCRVAPEERTPGRGLLRTVS